MRADALVIGAGHNGLVAAALLAQAGRRVVVLEGRDIVGGLCAPEEFHPGYRDPGLHHDTSMVASDLVGALRLERYGLELEGAPPAILATSGEGQSLLVDRDPAKAEDEIGVLSREDARAYGEWRGFLDRVGGFVRGLLSSPPPALTAGTLREWLELGRRGLALRRLGRRDMRELLRVMPMCSADWLQERFESELLAELLAAPSVMGTRLGPWSAGTAANLLFHECRAGNSVKGGPAALVEALRAACEDAGAEIRTTARVKGIRLKNGVAVGVELADGEFLEAPVVAASCDPRLTLLELLPPASLSMTLTGKIRVWRTRGTTAKIRFAVSGPLEIAGREGERYEALRVGTGTIDGLERAFDAVKYRRWSAPLHLDVRVPTAGDPSLAPEGHQVVSILASFVPHDLEGGWTEESREALGDAVTTRLAEVWPGLEAGLVARQVLTPADLEERYALSGGHLHHGEHALDQLLFMRPAPELARYATPVPGLYLAGSGSHPGGGVTGRPGMLAAQAILGG